MTNKIKILLLATLFYTSCNSSKYPKSLVEIDSLCYSNPQLALTKLEQIGRVSSSVFQFLVSKTM